MFRRVLADAANLLRRMLRAGHPGEDVQGVLLAPLAKQPARTFRDEEEQDQIERRRDRLYPEHPAPAGVAHAQQEIIGEEGGGDADDDHQLIQRNQAPAQLGWRNFRDVDRRDENGAAHRDAAQHPREHKHRKTCRPRRHQGRDGEQHRCEHQDFFAAKGIAQETRQGVAAQRAPAQAAHRQAQLPVPARAGELEIFLDERHRPGNHRGIKAQEKSADRDDERHGHGVHFAFFHNRNDFDGLTARPEVCVLSRRRKPQPYSFSGPLLKRIHRKDIVFVGA